MTDTEGTEARRSDGEETQFIQPIRDYGRAETKPLDLPRATIGGYRADAVERRVAELERRRALDQAEIIRLKRENHARQTENGELNQRLTMLREQNKKLEYQASNPSASTCRTWSTAPRPNARPSSTRPKRKPGPSSARRGPKPRP